MRGNALKLFVCISAIAVLYFGWDQAKELSLAQPSTENEITNSLDTSEAAADSAVFSDTVEAVGSSDSISRPFEQPLGKFKNLNVVESRILNRSDQETVVEYLIAGDSDFPLMISREEQVYDAASEEWLIAVERVMKADEIIFDADPQKVDAVLFEEFLVDENLVIIERSQLSDFVQIKINNPSLDRFYSVLETARNLFPDTIIEEDHIQFSSAFPSEWNGALSWHLDQTNAPDAWEINTGSQEVVIAVLDTGIRATHQDLQGNLFINDGEVPSNGIDDDNNGFVDDVSGWDFFSNDASPNDQSGHGTHVSGILGAVGDNGAGTAGVNWNVKILPLRVGNQSGLGTSDINEALRYVELLKNSGVNIVATNNSYGSSSPNNSTRNEIREHESLGILFVAASGNDGDNIDGQLNQYPAGYSEDIIISVGNSNQSDRLSASSNYGAQRVDIAAPGENVYSTYNSSNSSYQMLSGTSMSSPMVAGAVGLLASNEPSLTWRQIKQRILDTADPQPSMEGRLLTGGRLNLLSMLKPDLADHGISVSSHPGSVILVPSSDIPVEFLVEAKEGAILSFDILDVSNGIAITETTGPLFTASFSDNGFSHLRFTAELDGIRREIDKYVFVGPIADVSSGLHHSWNFEEQSGNAIDSAGSASAQIENATRIDSPLGKAMDFSGSNSRASYTEAFVSQVTFSAFVRNDLLDSSPHPRIVDSPHYSFYFSTATAEAVDDGNKRTLKFLSERTGGFNVWNAPPDSIFANDWMHVLATYDSRSVTNNPRLFINGQEQIVRMQGIGSGSQLTATATAYIGDRNNFDRAWDGAMDELRIYDRQLSEEEAVTLSARYLQARWNEYDLVASETEGIQAYSFQNDLGLSPNATYAWRISENGGAYELLENDTSSIELSLASNINYTVVLDVSDEWSTQAYSATYFRPSDIEPGVLTGSFDGEGVVWLEIEPSLTNGYVTVFDTNSGTRLFREAITIGEGGVFQTSSGSPLAIEGSIDGGFSGQIVDSGLAFTGEPSSFSSASEFTGFYTGGILAENGAGIEMRVLDSGQALLWQYGFELDLAQGLITNTGNLNLSSLLGTQYSGILDAEALNLSGQFSNSNRAGSFFLRHSDNSPSNRFVNLSSRAVVEPGDGVAIGGFVVAGDQPRRMLIRAVGPSLNDPNLANPLDNPVIDLYRNGQLLARNEVWWQGDDQVELQGVFNQFGASLLQEGSLDAALLLDLEPGLYGAIASGIGGEPSGDILMEIYDASGLESSSVVNLSTRGKVEGLVSPLIAGIVISGDEPKQVLIRAIGPSMAVIDPDNLLQNPVLDLYSGSQLIAQNDDWSDASEDEPIARLEASFDATGAFSLNRGTQDAAILIWLEPGIYGAVVTGQSDTSGLSLVEVYEMP